jgi:hypothetical protein
VPLPVPAGQTIDQLRLYLPHRDGPVLISEISLRGEDGTASSHRFSDGGE